MKRVAIVRIVLKTDRIQLHSASIVPSNRAFCKVRDVRVGRTSDHKQNATIFDDRSMGESINCCW